MSRIRLFGLLCVGLLAACGTARYTQRTQAGGTLALNGDQNKAMEDAHRQMAQHCGPGNYTIISEGEVVVGQDTAARADTDVNRDGSVTQTAGSNTRNAVEWRVTYQCGVAAPPPVQPPPVQGQPPGTPPS